MKKIRSHSFLFNIETYYTKIIGLILLAIGIVFFYYPMDFNLKLGTMLLIIGGLIFFLIPVREKFDKYENVDIILIIVIWALFVFILTPKSSPETYFLLVAIGIAVINELTNGITSPNLKKNLNIFLVVIFLIFLLIITQKIISIFYL